MFRSPTRGTLTSHFCSLSVVQVSTYSVYQTLVNILLETLLHFPPRTWPRTCPRTPCHTWSPLWGRTACPAPAGTRGCTQSCTQSEIKGSLLGGKGEGVYQGREHIEKTYMRALTTFLWIWSQRATFYPFCSFYIIKVKKSWKFPDEMSARLSHSLAHNEKQDSPRISVHICPRNGSHISHPRLSYTECRRQCRKPASHGTMSVFSIIKIEVLIVYIGNPVTSC